RDSIADAPRHARFHAVAESARNASLIVEPPILDEPYEVSVNRNRLRFLDDQCAGQTAPKLLQRVLVRVIPECAGVGRGELIDEALAGTDRLLREGGHPVHRVRQADAMPMDGRVLAESVADHESDWLALPNPEFRARNSPGVGS